MEPLAALDFPFLVHHLPRSLNDRDLRWLSPFSVLTHVNLHTLSRTTAGPGDDVGIRRLSDPPTDV